MTKIDEKYIRSIVEQVLAERQPPQPVQKGLEFTPNPPTGKRRNYIRTTITVDAALWELVQEECQRLSILPPKLIDTLLWNHFGQPQLSFQKEDKT